MSVRAGHPYTVKVRVGGLSWTVDKGDAPGFGPMAPMSVGWKFPDDGLWPTAPEPANLQLSLVVPTAATVATIDVGTSVHVEVFLGIDDGAPDFTPLPSVVFTGQVAQMDSHPVRAWGQDAWQLDLSCMDYLASLGEREVAGYIPFQGVGVQTWVETLFKNAGLPVPDWNGGGWGQAQLTLNEGRIDPGSLLETVDAILASYADGGDILPPYDESVKALHEWYPYEGWRRGYLQPVTDAITGIIDSWRVYWFSRRNTIAAQANTDVYPYAVALVAVDSGTMWTLVPSTGLAGLPAGYLDCLQVIDADYLDFGANWKRTKNTQPTTIIVSNNTPADEYVLDPWDQVAARTGETRPQIATRITDFNGYQQFNAEWAAEMLLPDVVPYKDTPQGFTWYASADPGAPLVPSWFPGVHSLWLGHSLPVVIDNLPPSQTPTITPGAPGPAWYAGTLSGATFVIEPGGTYRFDFTLRPGAPEPGGLDITDPPNSYLRPKDVNTTAAATGWTPATTDLKLTPHHLRLARRTK